MLKVEDSKKKPTGFLASPCTTDYFCQSQGELAYRYYCRSVRPSVRRSVRPRFPKTPPGGAPIRAKIGGDVQRGRGMKAVKTPYEKVAPVPRKKITKVLFP